MNKDSQILKKDIVTFLESYSFFFKKEIKLSQSTSIPVE